MAVFQHQGNKLKRKDGYYYRGIHIVIAFSLGCMMSATLLSSRVCSIYPPSVMTTARLSTADDAGVLEPVVVAPTTTTTLAKEHSFHDIAIKFGTDKVSGTAKLVACIEDPTKCQESRKEAKNLRCRIVGHFYQDLYQRWLAPLSKDDDDSVKTFSFLEIGFGRGFSVPAWREFLPRADYHVIDIACRDLSTASAEHRPKYEKMIKEGKLHCGDSANFEFLHSVYTKQFKDNNLKIVLDDASHVPKHMVATVWFWLPRIEPGGFLILEDIEPNVGPQFRAHAIQSDFLPQLINDVHYCGDPSSPEPTPCFPSLQPLVKSVHCDLHVCIIERTELIPAYDPPKAESVPPPNALDRNKCFGRRE